MSHGKILSVVLMCGCCFFADSASGEKKAKKGDRKAQLLKRFDENGNGRLDPEEREKAPKKLQRRQGKAQPGGQLNREKLMKRFDQNQDGQLNMGERKRLFHFLQQKRNKLGRNGRQPKGSGKRPTLDSPNGKGERSKLRRGKQNRKPRKRPSRGKRRVSVIQHHLKEIAFA